MSRAASDLVALFDVDVTGDTLPEPSWNIAPTQALSLLVDAAPRGVDAGGPPVRRLASARWGLIPSWSDDPRSGATAFNARVETAAEKPTFRDAVVSRRAVVPVTGYYEWVTDPSGARTPVHIHLPDEEVLLLAALYEWWRDPSKAQGDPSRWVLSTSILTRPSTGALAAVHDRMPIFVDAQVMQEWLDPDTEGDDDLLRAISDEGAGMADQMIVDPADASMLSAQP